MLKVFFWHFTVYFPRCLCPHPGILNYHFFLYFKNVIWFLLLDVTCQSEPLWSPGRRKESTEGKEEKNVGEARMGCKSRWDNKPVRLLWRNRYDGTALVAWDSAPNVIGWNGFWGMLYSRSWKEEKNPSGIFKEFTCQGLNLYLWRGYLKRVGSMFLKSPSLFHLENSLL